GAASAAAAAFSGLADVHGDWASAATPFAVLGTTAMMIGIPLWFTGAKRNPPADGPPMIRRSRGVMAGGIAITMVGAATMGGGAIVTSFGSTDREFRQFVGATTFGALGLVLAGIPMWYFGQENIPEPPSSARAATRRPVAAREAPPMPEINVGPTGLSM